MNLKILEQIFNIFFEIIFLKFIFTIKDHLIFLELPHYFFLNYQ